jgi:hypothetical protein
MVTETTTFLTNLNTIWQEHKTEIGEALDGIILAWDTFYTLFEGTYNLLVGLLTGDWERAWAGLKDVVSGALEGVINVFIAGANIIISIWNKLLPALQLMGLNFGFGQLSLIAPVDFGEALTRAEAIVAQQQAIADMLAGQRKGTSKGIGVAPGGGGGLLTGVAPQSLMTQSFSSVSVDKSSLIKFEAGSVVSQADPEDIARALRFQLSIT